MPHSITEETLAIPAGKFELEGDLAIPGLARGLVLFAHGSGSSRKSPRNRFVAQVLQGRRLGTLLFDLLTEEEDRIDAVDARLRFDISLLATRLGWATDWISRQPGTRGLPIGYFGASTGAAAALMAAAERPRTVRAVVSRGGRPDLAGDALARVIAPTLLIVGGDDPTVLALNRRAYELLTGPKEFAIVAGATHLFNEPGAMEDVARLSGNWFARHLSLSSEEGFGAHP